MQYDRQYAEATREKRLGRRVGAGSTLGESHQWFAGFVGIKDDSYVLATGYKDPTAAEYMVRGMSQAAAAHFGAPVPVIWKAGAEAFAAL